MTDKPFTIGKIRACRHCERWLKPMKNMLVCPCCAEVTMLIPAVVGSHGPDSDGYVTSGMVLANRAGGLKVAPARHACDPKTQAAKTSAAKRHAMVATLFDVSECED